MTHSSSGSLSIWFFSSIVNILLLLSKREFLVLLVFSPRPTLVHYARTSFILYMYYHTKVAHFYVNVLLCFFSFELRIYSFYGSMWSLNVVSINSVYVCNFDIFVK
eukprot:Rmarinus@m.25874